MEIKIFISYPKNSQDIVENLRGKLKEFNVDAWVYSRDKTLSENAWVEIETKIIKSKLFIYAFSKETPKAEGQSREINIALKHSEKNKDVNILPISIDEPCFSQLPKDIKFINGDTLTAYNVKSIAKAIVNRFFTENDKTNIIEWNYPVPGDWLEVVNFDEYVEEDLDIGDKLYFRKISPLGLFECYFPKLNNFYWVCHEHVAKYAGKKDLELLNKSVPFEFTILNMVEIEERAWRDYYKRIKIANI